MKVEIKKEEGALFKDLNYGDLFRTMNSRYVWMKFVPSGSSGCVTAVSVSDGSVLNVRPDDHVMPVKGILIIEE